MGGRGSQQDGKHSAGLCSNPQEAPQTAVPRGPHPAPVRGHCLGEIKEEITLVPLDQVKKEDGILGPGILLF